MPTAESRNAADDAFDEHIAAIVNAVVAERLTQNVKWGLQRHPTLDPSCQGLIKQYDAFMLPTSNDARNACNDADTDGYLTWTHIAVEELAEAVEAAVLHGEHSAELRTELVQLAAVVFAWIESVDAGQ